MQALLAGGAFELQQHFAAKADVFFGDGDGIPGEATLLALLDAGLGIFEFELRQVFLLLKLHEGPHAAQLFFNSIRVGADKVEVGQRDRDLTAPNFEVRHHFKSGGSC